MKLALTLLTLTLGLSAVSHAAVIAINNGNFSTYSTSGTHSATGWTDNEVGGGVTYYGPGGSAPNGVAYLQGSGTSSSPNFNGIVQNLSTANSGLTVTTWTNYTITFEAGFRNDVFTGIANMTVSLVDLGLDGVYQTSDSVLASQIFSRAAGATGSPASTMTQEIANLSFSSSSTNNIALVFQNTTTGNNVPDGNGTYRQTGMIDNVSVTAIPEPSAALLGGIGMLGLLHRRRR